MNENIQSIVNEKCKNRYLTGLDAHIDTAYIYFKTKDRVTAQLSEKTLFLLKTCSRRLEDFLRDRKLLRFVMTKQTTVVTLVDFGYVLHHRNVKGSLYI